MWSAINLDCNNVYIRMLGLTLDMYFFFLIYLWEDY